MKWSSFWHLIKWIFIGGFIGEIVTNSLFTTTGRYYDYIVELGIILGVFTWYMNKKSKNKK